MELLKTISHLDDYSLMSILKSLTEEYHHFEEIDFMHELNNNLQQQNKNYYDFARQLAEDFSYKECCYYFKLGCYHSSDSLIELILECIDDVFDMIIIEQYDCNVSEIENILKKYEN